MDNTVPGLQSGGAQGQPAPAPDPDNDGDNDAAGPDSDQDGADASPEEEKQLVEFVSQCKLMLYNRKNPQIIMNVIKLLKSGQPVQQLARVAVMIVTRVEAGANQAGDKLDPAVLLHGGYAVVEDIADFSSQVSKTQGTPRYTEQQVQQAYLLAVDMYRSQKQSSGQLDRGSAQQDLQTMKQADSQGDLDQVLPGANDAAKTLGKDAAPGAGGSGAGNPAAGANRNPGAAPAAPPLQKRRKRRRR